MNTSKTRIGLDIGSSAVRAAEVTVDGDKRVLKHFAQVGLPAGAVVEGEVRDRGAVTDAVKRLWQHGGFSGKQVVLGIGSQRAMVRQVQMPPMSDQDLRSAIKFKIGEFLPIPVEQAVADFAPLPSSGSDDSRRVLLLAAQRDVVIDEVAAVEAAGLRVVAVDSSSLALLRGIEASGPAGDGTQLEAVVGIGAELVTVVVGERGMPRFVRTVALASGGQGSEVDNGSRGPTSSGRSPLNSGRTGNLSTATGTAQRLEAIVTEVRSSLEYLLSQTGTARFERVLVTGGGAMLPGVVDALSNAVGLKVELAHAHLTLDRQNLGLTDAALEEASYRWLSAVGLALWGIDAYGKPSLLPEEVLQRRQEKRAVPLAIAAATAFAVVLGTLSFMRISSAASLNSQIQSDNTESVQLQTKINGLEYVLKIPGEVQSQRALATQALAGDIQWVTMMHRIASAMPANVDPASVVLIKAEPNLAGGASSVVPATVGTVTIAATTKGGATAVAAFIDNLSRVNGMSYLWVNTVNDGGGVIGIQANADLSAGALSDRAAHLPGGNS